jgi:hypothetical protein
MKSSRLQCDSCNIVVRGTLNSVEALGSFIANMTQTAVTSINNLRYKGLPTVYKEYLNRIHEPKVSREEYF